MSIPTPNLEDLIKQRIAVGGEGEAQAFFDIANRPNQSWLNKLKPGIDASQKVLSSYLNEQQTGDQTKAAGQSEEDARRESLCMALFGPAHLNNFEGLLSSIKSKMSARLDLRKLGEGALEIQQISPIPKATPTEPEPKEGLIPTEAVAPNGSSLEDLQRRLKPRVRFEPEDLNGNELEAILKAVLEGRWARKVVMLLPLYDKISPHVAYHFMAHIRKQPWLGVEREKDTLPHRARNLLAQKFLRSEAEWSWWMDSDMIAPFGDPGFFYAPNGLNADPTFIKPEFTRIMMAERLLLAGKSIVGAVYNERRAGKSGMMIQPEMFPRDSKDRALSEMLHREGPRNEVVEVGFVATGCAMVHRKVYEDIMAFFPQHQPSNAEEPYNFFGHNVESQGEDIAFCGLAQKAGHKSYLDLGAWCAHVGDNAFFPRRY